MHMHIISIPLWYFNLILACKQAALVPQCSMGETGVSPGVFTPGVNVASSQVFGWELILTFILVHTSPLHNKKYSSDEGQQLQTA